MAMIRVQGRLHIIWSCSEKEKYNCPQGYHGKIWCRYWWPLRELMAKAIFWQWWRADIPSNWTLDDHKDYWIEPTDLLTTAHNVLLASRHEAATKYQIGLQSQHLAEVFQSSTSQKKKHPQTSINLFFLVALSSFLHPTWFEKRKTSPKPKRNKRWRDLNLTWSCSPTWKANSHRFAFSKALLLAAKDTTVASWKGRIVQSIGF